MRSHLSSKCGALTTTETHKVLNCVAWCWAWKLKVSLAKGTCQIMFRMHISGECIYQQG